MQKIALVLAAVGSTQQFVAAITLTHTGIVTGGDACCTELHGVIEKGAELDFGIAQHIRIGRATGRVLTQKFCEHPLFVFGGKVHRFQFNADDIGYRSAIDQILTGGTVFIVVIVFPVLHKETDDFIAGTLEQQRRHGGIDATGHADHDALSGHAAPYSAYRERSAAWRLGRRGGAAPAIQTSTGYTIAGTPGS